MSSSRERIIAGIKPGETLTALDIQIRLALSAKACQRHIDHLVIHGKLVRIVGIGRQPARYKLPEHR